MSNNNKKMSSIDAYYQGRPQEASWLLTRERMAEGDCHRLDRLSYESPEGIDGPSVLTIHSSFYDGDPACATSNKIWLIRTEGGDEPTITTFSHRAESPESWAAYRAALDLTYWAVRDHVNWAEMAEMVDSGLLANPELKVWLEQKGFVSFCAEV